MEFVFQYFIFIKLIILVVVLFSAYKSFHYYAINEKLMNFWTILLLIMLTLLIINPVKLQPTTYNINSIIDDEIENQKKDIEALRDNSFKHGLDEKGITKEDLK